MDFLANCACKNVRCGLCCTDREVVQVLYEVLSHSGEVMPVSHPLLHVLRRPRAHLQLVHGPLCHRDGGAVLDHSSLLIKGSP